MKKLLLVVVLLVFCPSTLKGEMSSTNYTIYADTFSVGGVYSTSNNFSLYDSVGEWPASVPASANYEIRAGFQAMELGDLKLVIADSSLSLGALDVASIKSDNTNINVTSGSASGYILSIGEADPSPIFAVADGAVTIGSEEYGASVGGANANFLDDREIATGLVLASSTVAVANDLVVFTVKAARNSTTNYGSKNQNLILNLSANF
ncbi:MAG: hypothetical protein US42_C0008G0004 [Candidatus Magasanikbacteria bacterium GW2011_GWC2_37_14]|uniref:Uncharacterized protein n=1 Tax=Candidatus Magasanikbacteria bacterium GW2011_GWC2_37_14 TaxID=1619046 RepID=A0A0G0G8R5_9BACT|nr:MAG: hypothetical protein US42_C0008G0004 [Candidatus Magasanikbacteria bacterium GW2011_GWC2_37_14]